MELGESRITNGVLKMLGNDTINKINNYIDDIGFRDFMVIDSIQQVNSIFSNLLDKFLISLSEDELMYLRTWTSYNFSNINAVLRNNWTYEKNGLLTDEKKIGYRHVADMVSNLVNKFSMPQVDFVTFRGTTIDSFSKYGINELTQLKSLKGKFLYEQGFTSTSMLENSSYFKKDFNDGKKYNIEMKCLIPCESNDGVLLINRDTSHYDDECEFLIDKGSLFKVIDVKIDVNTDTANMIVVLIPKKIYDLNYNKDKISSINK